MFNLKDMKEEQLKLARKVVLKNEYDATRYIAGVDQSFFENKIISAIVVVDSESMEVIEMKYAIDEVSMPYISGYLSYRECPAALKSYSLLEKKPDIIMVDGNGILHPRKIGFASHLGILLDMPTIGVAKSLLLGDVVNDKIVVEGETLAVIIHTREGSKPIYVSPGHRITISKCAEIVKSCLNQKHKLPLPLQEAHRYATKIRKTYSSTS